MFRRTLLVLPRRKLLVTRRGGGRIERYLLRQTRVFGESPEPLRPEQVIELVRGILLYVGAPLAADGDLGDLVHLVEPFYSKPKLEKALRLYGSDRAADEAAESR